MQTPKTESTGKYDKTMVCTKCGHVQVAIARGVAEHPDGSAEMYYGSNRHFCEECDAPVQEQK